MRGCGGREEMRVEVMVELESRDEVVGLMRRVEQTVVDWRRCWEWMKEGRGDEWRKRARLRGRW